jgi:hypothetical protein
MLPGVLKRGVLVLVLVLGLTWAASAAFAGAPALHDGTYAPKESWVKNHTSASVDLEVIKHGTAIRAIGSGLSCDNNGQPPLDQYGGIEMTIQPPHAISISKSGHFSFSGTAKVSAYEDQTPFPVTTHYTISGQFIHGTIKPLKTIAVTGAVSDNYCVASTAKHFKLVYDPGA